jgi:hypothetical protein
MAGGNIEESGTKALCCRFCNDLSAAADYILGKR